LNHSLRCSIFTEREIITLKYPITIFLVRGLDRRSRHCDSTHRIHYCYNRSHW